MYNIEILKETKLLTQGQSADLLGIMDDLMAGFKNIETRRPKYLMEVAVLNNEKLPTPDAKYWQAILERDVQFTNLIMESYDYKEKQADIEIKTVIHDELVDKNTPIANARAKKISIQLQRANIELKMMERNGNARYKEVMNWTDIINDLQQNLKYSSTNQNEHMPESFLLKCASQKRIIQEIGASDMNGAMNIIGLGKSALKYFDNMEK